MTKIESSKKNNLIQISEHLKISEDQLAVRIAQQIQLENKKPEKSLEERFFELSDEFSELSSSYIALQLKYWSINDRLRKEIGFKEHDKFMEEIK